MIVWKKSQGPPLGESLAKSKGKTKTERPSPKDVVGAPGSYMPEGLLHLGFLYM